MPSREAVQQLDIALTTMARNMARREDIPFSRRVKYTESISHDLKVPRDSRKIFVSTLEEEKVISLLGDAVTAAARIDHGYLTADDWERILSRAERSVSQLSWHVVKACRARDFEKAEDYMSQLQQAVWQYEDVVERAQHD